MGKNSSEKGTDSLIGRAVIDPDFRRRLLTDPEATIAAEGYEVSPEIMGQLKGMDPAAAEAAAANLDAAFADRRAAS
jgi:hypothetical protein